MAFFIEQFITGLSIGSILLLVALGLSIIYGSMGVINMAHGEFIMLGAYGAWALNTYLGITLFPGLIIIFCGLALLGAILVAGMQGALSESEVFLETWTLVMGALFVLVVLFLPNGIASIFDGIARKTGLLASSSFKPVADEKAGGT